MLRPGVLLLSLCVPAAFAGRSQILSSLPAGTVAKSVQTDAAGNIYVAGAVAPSSPKSATDVTDAFVAKLTPTGATVFYLQLAGSAADSANALALGADGSIYVAGTTSSPDFPATTGAFQTAFGATNGSQAFAVRIDPSGAVRYLTYLGGTAVTTGLALAANNAGEVYVTGATSTGAALGYLMKLDASGAKLLISTSAFGGSRIALDAQSNIYLAGADISSSAPGLKIATPGAFQTSHPTTSCAQSTMFNVSCVFQFVLKVDPTGTKILFGTYIAGSLGATPAAIAVDPAGNVIVAGTTNSSDYPVTAGAFQTEYLAAALPPPQLTPQHPVFFPSPATGYVTKLNATGTALVWSTFFGGSGQDAISGMSLDAAGNVYLSGAANSDDLPGLFATPSGCRPSVNQGLGFVARLSPDGTSATPTQLVYGVPSCSYEACSINIGLSSSAAWITAVRSDNTAVAVSQTGTVAAVGLFAAARLACLTDPADNVQLSAVAPGQVLTLFGEAIGPANFAAAVNFDGIAALLLYVSPNQINVQVPYEIAGHASTKISVTQANATVDSRTVSVVAQQPALMLNPDAFATAVPAFSNCGNHYEGVPHALALNPDGSLNSCANPAPLGSTVTLVVNGLGVTTPAQTTGAISAAPPVPLTPAVGGAGAIATTTIPGLLSALSQVAVKLPSTPAAAIVSLTLGGQPIRQRSVILWVSP